jgi:heme/copper-type cytochrome/quinol oxidase subunit 2
VLEIAAAATSFVFFSPGLGIHLTLQPGMPARVQLRPETAGQFVFSCAARDSGLPVLNGTISVID